MCTFLAFVRFVHLSRTDEMYCRLSDYPDPIRINAHDADSSYGCAC